MKEPLFLVHLVVPVLLVNLFLNPGWASAAALLGGLVFLGFVFALVTEALKPKPIDNSGEISELKTAIENVAGQVKTLAGRLSAVRLRVGFKDV